MEKINAPGWEMRGAYQVAPHVQFIKFRKGVRLRVPKKAGGKSTSKNRVIHPKIEVLANRYTKFLLTASILGQGGKIADLNFNG